ncbi:hypothetical protein SAMN05444362_102466 [Dysgonomonas macrotermitis]|uniref:Fimbrillin-A associated anchor protein Mfa1 and Mfa2 n=2 Tax=Dysgonomonas macrotermitis TaxID=1346286 RepID=A0A1M4XBT9_9BACT|nr:hypothetical protein SAMN05444362_102466 [Dysgonomonas macrotermitis]
MATIKLRQNGFEAAVIDEDNLESEQTIKNITILLTDPSSDIITHKYVNAGFSDVDDYRLVTLPVELSELGRKDIYVITNYGNSSLQSLTTISDLKEKTTPAVNKTNNLDPEDGLCMFGKTLDFDFNNDTNSPAIVYAVRTCAKYRITLTFPDNPTLSTNNTFLIANAANYTYIVNNTGNSIPSNAYFNFAAESPLLETSNANEYSNIAYVYEADKAPQMHIYTHPNNSTTAEEFFADLPIPRRNYLYDIEVQVLDGGTRSLSAGSNSKAQFVYNMKVTTYNNEGNVVEPQ